MQHPTVATAPLTRRQAREIERATGVRPIAGASQTGDAFRATAAATAATALVDGALTRRALREQRRREELAAVATLPGVPAPAPVAAAHDFRHDTGEIARNELTALISVLPTELVARIGAEPAVAPARTDEQRGASVRAAVPASLAAARRRRTVAGFAAAASITAAATTGIVGMGADAAADAQHRANLAEAAAEPQAAAPEPTAAAAEPEAAEAPAPEIAASEADTSIAQFSPEVLAMAAESAPVAEAQLGQAPSAAGLSTIQSPVGPGATFSSGFGYRVPPIAGARPFHNGIDLSQGCGSPLYAVTSGTIGYTGWDGTYGERLDVVSDDGRTRFLYAHLQGYAVAPGQHVNAGDLIGYMGTTGLSTGCHLHFEVFVDGGNVDPRAWLADRGVHV